jgi:hypothetical protein
MTNRAYRLLVGVVLLTGLYFELPILIYGLIGLTIFEGITNWRLPIIVNWITGRNQETLTEGSLGLGFKQRIPFDAERAWRLVLGSVLFIVYVLYYDHLWFLAWFMGFAIFGAGLSGVCPLFIGLKWAGFR